MSLFIRAIKCLALFLVLCAVTTAGTQNVLAENSAIKELLMSHVMPGDIRESPEKEVGSVERFLMDTWKTMELRADAHDPLEPKIPWRTDQKASNPRHGGVWDLPQAQLPGFLSSRRFPAVRMRLAAAGPIFPAIDKQAKVLIDGGSNLAVAGSLVGNPGRLFSGFEILVNVKTFTLELYGIKGSSDRTLLYSEKVGLGSPEYPTPRGSYFIRVIYDDRPLWIPPPSDWAYGQEPSHSVYGGHMMPFFRKIVGTNPKGDELVDELDNIAPQVKMVDGGMYRIHGTDSPWSVGSNQSHGCVRMKNKTVKLLADTLKLYVGEGPRGRSANGAYVTLARPVRLVLY